MLRKLNLGAGPLWHKDGWQVVDHKSHRPRTAAHTGFPAGCFDIIFSSHMLEHVPHFQVHDVLGEMSRVLTQGGTVRLLCPDLAKVARMYVDDDHDAAKLILAEDPSLRTDLGLGGVLVNLVVSPGQDNFLFDREGKFVGGYAHVYGYDFDMLKALLEHSGFDHVRRMGFCESETPDFLEPLHLSYRDPVWMNQQDWDVDPELGMRTSGFDRDPFHSLIVEAVKVSEPRGQIAMARSRIDTIPSTFGYDLRIPLVRMAKLGTKAWRRILPKAWRRAAAENVRKWIPASQSWNLD